MNLRTLPEELESFTIGKMSPGDKGYTLPWGMWADKDRVLWINRNYPVESNPHGTCTLAIEMGRGIVFVDRSSIGDHTYDPGDSGWDGFGIPVELVYGDEASR